MKKVFSLRKIPRKVPAILLSASALFLNVTGVIFALGRRCFLKDTGRKLAHFDRELNADAPALKSRHKKDKENAKANCRRNKSQSRPSS